MVDNWDELPEEGYATVQDLKDRWPDFPVGGESQAALLLWDASVEIDAICPDVQARIDSGALNARIPEMIVCDMVRRAMIPAVAGMVGVTSNQETVGPFNRSLSFSNPMGDLYTTKKERKLLGCGSQKAFMIDLMPDPDRARF